MASVAASGARPVVVDVSARPARSATRVRFAGLAVLCAMALVAPALLLVWMPIVLGVPHIASDIRYLVLPLPRRQLVVAVAACVALVGLKAASLVTAVSLVSIEMAVVAAWLAVAVTLRRWRVGVLAACLLIVALPIQFAIAAAFAHNAIAIVAWVVVKRPAPRHVLAVLAAIAAAVAILVAVGPAVAAATGGDATRWLTVDGAASVMFGGVPLPTARALMIAFAFLQAVHYTIWLDWIPRGTPMRVTPIAVAVATATLAVIGAALVDAAWARTTYLALATFHIYLEIVILAAMLARRRS